MFGLYKRNEKMYTEIVPDATAHTPPRIVRGHTNINSVIYSNGWHRYDGLVDPSYEKHFHVNHGNNKFSDTKGNHNNGTKGLEGIPSTV
jgi:hypothetical protein